jgi:hypothetical protein
MLVLSHAKMLCGNYDGTRWRARLNASLLRPHAVLPARFDVPLRPIDAMGRVANSTSSWPGASIGSAAAFRIWSTSFCHLHSCRSAGRRAPARDAGRSVRRHLPSVKKSWFPQDLPHFVSKFLAGIRLVDNISSFVEQSPTRHGSVRIARSKENRDPW